ncbi:MAG: RICIN domain-containing protein [Candidatus Nanopelagicales bacterium]|nr:RICIN domain-containing protein [Candidatus Nanopelagicales bacterium]
MSLDSVLCAATEDDCGVDEFYLLGAITDGSVDHTAAVLTQPLRINANQDRRFGRGGGAVFDAELADEAVLKIALAAFDKDLGSAWSDYEALYGAVSKLVMASLPALGVGAPATAIVAASLVVADEAVKLDKDDHLGDIAVDLDVRSLPSGTRHRVGTIEGSHAGSHYRYMVSYSVTSGEATPASVYTIKAVHSGKVLDVAHAEHRNGAAVIQYDNHSRANQRFAVEQVDGEYARIVAQHSGLCLSAQDGRKAPGTPVVQWTCADGDHQLWKVERQPETGTLDVRFVNKASGLYLSVRDSSRSNKAPLVLMPRDVMQPDGGLGQGLNQLFILLPT